MLAAYDAFLPIKCPLCLNMVVGQLIMVDGLLRQGTEGNIHFYSNCTGSGGEARKFLSTVSSRSLLLLLHLHESLRVQGLQRKSHGFGHGLPTVSRTSLSTYFENELRLVVGLTLP